jgi:predicted GTPase
MSKQINIVIASQVGIGKTTVAYAIEKILREKGFKVSIRDKKKRDNEPVSDEFLDKVKDKAEIIITTATTSRNDLAPVKGL